MTTILVILAAAFAAFLLFIAALFVAALLVGRSMLRDARAVGLRIAPLAAHHVDPANVDDPVAYQIFHAEDGISASH